MALAVNVIAGKLQIHDEAGNPKRGYVASANQRIVPPNYRHVIYGAYSQAHRGIRINQVFAEKKWDTNKAIAFFYSMWPQSFVLINNTHGKTRTIKIVLVIHSRHFCSLTAYQGTI